MKVDNAVFVTSVADKNKFLKVDKPLIAVCGKSNVGKSSLINMLANRKKLAKTSVTPGRTRLINYFDFGDFMLADLPGYGYAKVSKEEKKRWSVLLEEFLATQDIRLVLSLVDIRHNPTADDKVMINYLYHYSKPFVLIATKADKIAKTKIKPQLQSIATYLCVGNADIMASSSETGMGKDMIFAEIEKAISSTD